eukprot:TRINITY_DN2886_c0_g1_i12.p1 TRINITY_DN2886_c0_g1~~TRINITY_DN2886_c0_g1_i12.p1  ORF type:complete len:452 (-),score=61.10 TRINITY_DN2886_c0_g1_i12:319-1614(-)
MAHGRFHILVLVNLFVYTFTIIVDDSGRHGELETNAGTTVVALGGTNESDLLKATMAPMNFTPASASVAAFASGVEDSSKVVSHTATRITFVFPSRFFLNYMDETSDNKMDNLQWLRFGVGIAAMQNFAPDHLCTLLSLSSITTSMNSLKLGAAWGLTHCIGTILVFAGLQVMRSYTPVDTRSMEEHGNYVGAILLSATAVYFMCIETQILEMGADGKTITKDCGCNGCSFAKGLAGDGDEVEAETKKEPIYYPKQHVPPVPPPPLPPALPSDVPAPPPPPPPSGQSYARIRKQNKPPTTIFMKKDKCQDENCADPSCSDSNPQAKEANDPNTWLYWGAFLGFVQGLLCPTALTSLNLLMRLHAWVQIVLFCICYTISSVILSGLMTYLWGIAAHSGAWIASPLYLYRGSCYFMFGFGFLWVFLTFTGLVQ